MQGFSNSTSDCIQSMQFEIDTLMEHLQTKQKAAATPQSEHLLMLIEDFNSTNMQSSILSQESEQLNEMLYSQSDYDAVLTRAQMNKILESLNGPINITKQVLLNLKQQLIDIEKEIENAGLAMKNIQESNQNYHDFMNKFKESQKQQDQQLLKQLGSSTYSCWNKIKVFFDAEIIQTSVPLGLIIKLQIFILKLFEPDNKQDVLVNIQSLIIEMNSNHPLIEQANQLEQIIPVLIKFNQQITKCLNSMHQNFCQLAQVFNQHNISYQLIQQVQKEINMQNQQIKQFQYKKSHLMIEMEKQKKQQKELQTQLIQLEKQVEKQIEIETQHLLTMYLKDKEKLITEIKKKYGKRYYENMISDIQKEFQKMCLKQQQQYDQSIEDAFQRVDCIGKQITNNKIKNQSLVQQYSQQKFKQVSSQLFSLNGVDKREYLLELQQCKIQLLQIENKIQRNIVIDQLPDILQQVQYQINDIKLRIQANSIPQKTRSDSIDALQRSNRIIEHHRSQSQAPLQSPRLPMISLPISNPLEIFDSNESTTSKDQTNQSRLTKRIDESSFSLNNENTNVTNLSNKQQTSYHQSQIQKKPILKDVGNILSNCEQIQNSLKSSRAKKDQLIRNEIKFNMMIYLQLEPTQQDYDPIMNYEQDPQEFGYKLFKMDQQFNLYICDQEINTIDLKEMLSNFNKHFQQLNDIKSVEINNCSLNALKFQNIYESSLRQACVESLALRHLRVRFFPFILIGGTKHHRGLATRKDDPIRNLTKEVKAASRLQRWFRARENLKLYQKMKKKNRYRKNVIAEIVNTERQYVADLKVICEKVKKSAQQYIPDYVQAIFMNCEELYQWNNEFLRVMELGYKGYDGISKPYKAVFEGNARLLMDPKIYGFRCYFDYCSKFTKSNQTIDKLKFSDQRYKQMMIAVSADLRGMDLASFLVKPVQRLPKYILLFKDLEKHTDEDYADNKSIKYLHKYFKDVNEENNKTMDIFLGRMQIAQLCDQFKINKDELLSDPKRTYKFEDKISIIQAEKEYLVQVHALSDMILITSNTTVLLSVRLDSLSFVKSQADSKYFSNLFQIVGLGETVQCLAETPAAKIKSMEQFEKLIQLNREEEFKRDKNSGKQVKMRYPVQVVVVGTEERNFQSFQKHTQYITEISINKVYQNIYIRFSEVATMNEKYRKKYPTIEFPQFPSQSWLAYQKTKSIEERKFVIEGFLQTLLQAKEVQGDTELLNDLKLPYNFYDLPDIYQTQLKSVFNKHQTTLEGLDELAERGILIQKLRMSAGEILRAVAVEKEIRRTNVPSICPNRVVAWQEKMATDPNLSKVTITMPDGSQTILGIDDRARVSEVLRFVAGFNQLIYYRDFRLYLIDRLKKQRVLDEDEILRKVVQDERDNSSGMLDKIEQWVTGSQNEKYIYMPIQLEEFDYREDSIRLMYLAFSIIDDVYDNKLQLGFKDYCLFAALFYHMKYNEQIEQSMNSLQLDKIRKVIPPDVYSGKQDKEWKNLTLQVIKQLDNQLNEISQSNRRDLLQRKEGAALKQIDKRSLAAQVTLNAAREFQQGNMAIFQVQTFQATQDYFKNYGIEVHATMYLGFSVNKIHFLNPQRKSEFRVIDYSKVKQVKSYPNQVVFEFSIFKELLRFDTFQSYEIKLLVEQYQEIQRFYLDYELGGLFDVKY